ncbi:MAG: glycogen debranching protein [Chromatiaceae bacterium]|nr:MAG: glycogen debranching protein [Chromatiaceae bacterium]
MLGAALPPLLRQVHLGRALCGIAAAAEGREWWLANGRGGYAAGTVAGTLTRRYHGLLIANAEAPLGRWLVLAKADATLHEGTAAWPLHSNRWCDDLIAPTGFRYIETFQLNGRMPVWTFAVAGVRIEQRIWLEYGRDRVHCAWRLLPGATTRPGLRLTVALLVAARDHHHLSRAGSLQPLLSAQSDRLNLRAPDCAALDLHLRAIGGTLTPDPVWVERFDLPLERERGLDHLDNHLRIARADLALDADRWVGIVAENGAGPAAAADCGGALAAVDLAASLQRQQARDRDLLATACGAERGGSVADVPLAGAPDWLRRLVLVADDFIVARHLPVAADTPASMQPDLMPADTTVIAGYPWFGDWGRDSMIALPGLCLATGRPALARRILLGFAGLIADGLLPNMFPGAGAAAAYNTVDAALWYLEAWRAYHQVSGDDAALELAWPALTAICAGYRDGTRYGIGMDAADGLIRAGEPGLALTWMDAKAGDWVVTPRIGKPVEINALWYNGLVAMASFACRLGHDPAPYQDLAAAAAAGLQRFVRVDGSGLYDLIEGPDGDDPAIRPNQVFALSLPASALDQRAAAQVVACCERHLLTSYGLRTLAPGDPAYRGLYSGDVIARDGAYHQGTVWPWLLGPYCLAEYRVTGAADLAHARLATLAAHLSDAGLGQISEILDGDPPHQPRGTPAQAWSVACVLEAWWRLQRDAPVPLVPGAG